MDTKTCTKCGNDFPLTEYQYSRPGVLRANCKICQSKYNRDYLEKNPAQVKKYATTRIESGKSRIYRQENKVKLNESLKEWGRKNPEKKRAQKYRHRYGIEISDYDEMFKAQNGRCAICDGKDYGRSGAVYFIVDHCHETNKVRGLLCHKCNMVLAYANDSLDVLKKAIEYIERH